MASSEFFPAPLPGESLGFTFTGGRRAGGFADGVRSSEWSWEPLAGRFTAGDAFTA